MAKTKTKNTHVDGQRGKKAHRVCKAGISLIACGWGESAKVITYFEKVYWRSDEDLRQWPEEDRVSMERLFVFILGIRKHILQVCGMFLVERKKLTLQGRGKLEKLGNESRKVEHRQELQHTKRGKGGIWVQGVYVWVDLVMGGQTSSFLNNSLLINKHWERSWMRMEKGALNMGKKTKSVITGEWEYKWTRELR